MFVIKDYTRLFFCMLRINIKGLKSYGQDFFVGIIAMIIKNIANIIGVFMIYEIIPVINGWSLPELLFLYAFSTISFSFWRCLFMNTLNVSYYVRNGELDSFLIKPIDPLFQIFMEGFDDDAWGDLLVGFIVCMMAMAQLQLPWWVFLLVVITGLFSSLIFASFSIMGSLLSLKVARDSDLSDMPYIVFDLIRYPISIYGQVMYNVFVFFFPIAWISYLPAKALITDHSQGILFSGISIGISLGLFVLCYAIWSSYLKHYRSTGT